MGEYIPMNFTEINCEYRNWDLVQFAHVAICLGNLCSGVPTGQMVEDDMYVLELEKGPDQVDFSIPVIKKVVGDT